MSIVGVYHDFCYILLLVCALDILREHLLIKGFIAWWKNHESHELPNWSSACRIALLIQPSSAVVERMFSLLPNSFGDAQSRSMEDYVESSIMLHYNSKT